MTILKSPPTVPACRLWNSQAENLAVSATSYYLCFDTVRYDNDNMSRPNLSETPLTSPFGSITIHTPGLYMIVGSARFATNATGRRAVQLVKNGDNNGAIASFNIQAVSDSGAPTQITATGMVNLNAGDYVDLNCFQASGGALTVVSSSGTITDLSPTLAATWMAGIIFGSYQ